MHDSILRVRDSLNRGCEEFFKACKEMAKYCQANKTHAFEMEEGLDMNIRLVQLWTRVGVGEIKPELVYFNCPGHRKLQKFSREWQDALYGKHVDVSVRESHKWVTRPKKISSLTGQEANQVFTQGYIRKPEEQVQHLEELVKRQFQPAVDLSYEVTQSGIRLHQDGTRTYTVEQLQEMVNALKNTTGTQ